MLASLHPNSPTSDQAVKDLIDQRARASHTRYDSASYSQQSDSPSIYSRAEFSPIDKTQFRGGWLTPVGDDMSLMDQGQSVFDDDEDDGDDEEDSHTTFTRNSFDRDDNSEFPPTEDDASVISTPTPRPLVEHSSEPPVVLDPNTDVDSPPTDETEDVPRMSMLGPKMRFVSKAPWELGGDDLLEEGEEEPGSAVDTLASFSSRMSSWRAKDQDKSTMNKGLGIATRGPRSPGLPSPSSKKGGFFRNQSNEFRRESPYGPHLSGASQSHGAIPASSSKFSQSVAESLSSDHLAYRHGHAQMPLNLESSQLSPHTFSNQNMSRSSYESGLSSRSESPSPSGQFVHPFANPENLPVATFEPPAPQIYRPPDISQDELPEERQGSPTRRASESETMSSPRTTSLRGLPQRIVTGDYGDNDDMSRIAARSRARAASRPATSSSIRVVPFGDQQGNPMHNLITLEQARARAQSIPNRARGDSNGTISTPKSTPSSTLVAGLGLAPGVVVDNGAMHNQGQRPSLSSPVPPSDSSPGFTMPEQKPNPIPRPRTMSSGKYGFGAGADGDVVPAKTIKHKRSAFMKLFQSKDKEREKDFKEPAFPAPDYPVRAKSTPPQLPPASDSPVPPLPNLHNIKRVPPPLPLSVFITSPSFPLTGSQPSQSQERASTSSHSPPRVRQASAPVPTSNQLSASNQQNDLQHLSSIGSESSGPAASAHANQNNFEALSLRPISTMFSAKFPDLLTPSPPSDNNNDVSSPASKRVDDPTPPTPGFSSSRSNSMSTSSDYPATPSSLPIPGHHPSLGILPSEDPSGVVASLQEQIVNSRKMWQRQIWELEGQVRDLKAEVEELRNTGDCDICGMAKRERRLRTPVPQNSGVVDRPRPRLGGGAARSVFGGGL